ncbi:unnamed protein product [Amoebophrya sp. A120]|nr:unnamed protein product [Amoebophrya sp. A120]|eukprot:GSA120T00018406001.1
MAGNTDEQELSSVEEQDDSAAAVLQRARMSAAGGKQIYSSVSAATNNRATSAGSPSGSHHARMQWKKLSTVAHLAHEAQRMRYLKRLAEGTPPPPRGPKAGANRRSPASTASPTGDASSTIPRDRRAIDRSLLVDADSDLEEEVAPITHYALPNQRKRRRQSYFAENQHSELGFPVSLPPGEIRSGRTPKGNLGYLVRTPANYSPNSPAANVFSSSPPPNANGYPLLLYLHGGATYAAADAPFSKADLKDHTPDDPWNLLDHDVLAFEQGCPFTLVADRETERFVDPVEVLERTSQATSGVQAGSDSPAPHLHHPSSPMNKSLARQNEQNAFPLAGDCVMLAPHVNKGRLFDDNGWWQWTYPDALEQLFEMLDIVVNKSGLRIDKDRLYVTGKSAGGAGAVGITLAASGFDEFRYPMPCNFFEKYGLKFAACAAVCPKGGRDDPSIVHEGEDDAHNHALPEATPQQAALEHYLHTPYYPSPPARASGRVSTRTENQDCLISKHIIHDDRTHRLTPPPEAGGEYVSEDAERRVRALLQLDIPLWFFVAEEDKWHAELYSDFNFDLCRKVIVEEQGGRLEVRREEPEKVRVVELYDESGRFRVRYTRYYKQMNYGHASWRGAYADEQFRDWFLGSQDNRPGMTKGQMLQPGGQLSKLNFVDLILRAVSRALMCGSS